ncbi:MAG TPA: lysylphosphatidylglycerol synthase transmembrane domain-containing protein [Sporichthyaceae bacterium]|jgi:uncharacterized protein (TIRG00374 family)|nr:lysylphosphatidylglycerol synthase transmembrane domain-containing protein [Sporichthyaceae bacterium]
MTITLERAESLGNIATLVPAPRVPDTAPAEAQVLDAGARFAEVEVGVEAEVENAPAGRSRRRWLTLPVVALLIWFLYGDRSTIQAGFVGLQGASTGWLAVAAAAGVVGLTVAGAVSQNGALAVPAPFGTMCAVQLAGSLVNQLLPAGTGAMAVTMRFLRRQGLTRGAAAAAMGLNQVVGVVVHVLLLGTVLAVEPGAVPLPHLSAETMVVSILVALLVGLAVAAYRRTPRPVGRDSLAVRVRSEVARLSAVMRDPSRAAALWLGSLATPLLQAVALYAVARSVGIALTPWHIAAVYLAASALAAVVPTPGGLGALDLTIAATLIASGVPATTAATTTVAFRLMTSWLPLLPGGLALLVLGRRRLI